MTRWKHQYRDALEKFCLELNREMGHREFLCFNGSDHSYEGPYPHWATHLNTTWSAHALALIRVSHHSGHETQTVEILTVPYDLLSVFTAPQICLWKRSVTFVLF